MASRTSQAATGRGARRRPARSAPGPSSSRRITTSSKRSPNFARRAGSGRTVMRDRLGRVDRAGPCSCAFTRQIRQRAGRAAAPDNNIVRVAIRAWPRWSSVAHGRCRCNGRDEALGLPTGGAGRIRLAHAADPRSQKPASPTPWILLEVPGRSKQRPSKSSTPASSSGRRSAPAERWRNAAQLRIESQVQESAYGRSEQSKTATTSWSASTDT